MPRPSNVNRAENKPARAGRTEAARDPESSYDASAFEKIKDTGEIRDQKNRIFFWSIYAKVILEIINVFHLKSVVSKFSSTTFTYFSDDA